MCKAQGRGPPSVIGQLIRWMLLKTKNFNNKKGNPFCPLVCKAQGGSTLSHRSADQMDATKCSKITQSKLRIPYNIEFSYHSLTAHEL